MYRLIITCFLMLTLTQVSAQEILYSWESPEGKVVETGGELTHHNMNGVDKRNIKCGEYYTFCLNGDPGYIDAEDGSDKASYMKVTLTDGSVLRAGDVIEITGMRNNKSDGDASIYFNFMVPTEVEDLSGTGTVWIDLPHYLFDTNVWNNLGLNSGDSFDGGTSSGAKANSGTEPLDGKYSAFPSTYSFIVPDDADGATSMKLTRYKTGNMLYVSKLVVSRDSATGIEDIKTVNKSEKKGKWMADDHHIYSNKDGKVYRIY